MYDGALWGIEINTSILKNNAREGRRRSHDPDPDEKRALPDLKYRKTQSD